MKKKRAFNASAGLMNLRGERVDVNQNGGVAKAEPLILEKKKKRTQRPTYRIPSTPKVSGIGWGP